MRLRSLLLVLCFVPVASADIIYDFSVNTTSISGTAGSLDFQFNPGPLATQAASLQILSFMSDGALVNCSANVQGFCNTGDVTGMLPGTLTFDNGTGFNDYFTGFTFGNTISFDVRLYGPAVNAPDGVSTSGTTFAFSMFSDAAGTMPALTTDLTDGFAATINVNLDGTTTVNNFSSQTTITPVASTVPEPSSLSLLATILGGMCFRWWKRRKIKLARAESEIDFNRMKPRVCCRSRHTPLQPFKTHSLRNSPAA